MTLHDPLSPCGHVTAWLNGGADPAHPAVARVTSHAPGCAACRAHVEAARAMEQGLARAVAVPPRFAEAVMARIAEASLVAAPPGPAPPAPSAAQRWRAALRSHEMAGGFLGGLFVAGVLPAAGQAARLLREQGIALPSLAAAPPAVLLGAGCAAALLAVPVAWACYRWVADMRA